MSSTEKLLYFFPKAFVLISSILLPIWAMVGTVALRNSLLFISLLPAIFFIIVNFRTLKIQLTPSSFLPVILLLIFFLWWLLHLAFPTDFAQQIKELKSTGSRAFAALLLSYVTGIVIAKAPEKIHYLILGLFSAFFFLILQYLTWAIPSGQLMQVHYFSYIYEYKINGVVTGLILIAFLCGAILYWVNDQFHRTLSPGLLISGIIGFAFPVYSFLFIFNSKNGMVISVILVALLICFVWCAIDDSRHAGLKSRKQIFNRPIKIFLFVAVGVLLSISFLHIYYNPSWRNFKEDVFESVKLDRHPQWINIDRLGYPILPDGREITHNIFERVSWATASINLMPNNVFGLGVLDAPLGRALLKQCPNLDPVTLPRSSHSGWLDLGLALGIPGVLLIWASILSSLFIGFRSSHKSRGITLFLSITVFLLYLVGELGSGHGFEILIFLAGLMAGMSSPFGMKERLRLVMP